MKVTIECDGLLLYGIPKTADELRVIAPATEDGMTHHVVLFLREGQIADPELARMMPHRMFDMKGRDIRLQAETTSGDWKRTCLDQLIVITPDSGNELPPNHGSGNRAATFTLAGGSVEVNERSWWRPERGTRRCIGEKVVWSGEFPGDALKIPTLEGAEFKVDATSGELKFLLRHLPLREFFVPDPSERPSPEPQHLHMLYAFAAARNVHWTGGTEACVSGDAQPRRGSFRRCLGAAALMSS